ncbi:MAG: STY4528 family pathogenicity island replication protein [Proteobacteria bacterium]|nr:STY4528 family pathogenicity island replication protein [Pseudomonadota bacterium]
MNTSPKTVRINDGFFFGGNRHETVPRGLLTDKRLTPLERNAWQVFRLFLDREGMASVPTYEHLRDYLSSMPGARASTETVSRVITILRLTRWLTLLERRRNTDTGRIVGNLYVLHDEPLSPFEAIQIDAAYLELVCNALEHACKAVRIVGQKVLAEITDDPMMHGRLLPGRLQHIMQRLAGESAQSRSYPQASRVPESEGGQKTPASDSSRPPSESFEPTSESEAGSKPAPDVALRNPKADSTSTVFSISTVRTEEGDDSDPRAGAREALRLPELFGRLKGSQQQAVLAMLAPLEGSTQQSVLDEWAARCRANSHKIRNPAGYLCGIINKAIKGEFTAWAASEEPVPVHPGTGVGSATSGSPPEKEPFRRAAPETVQACMERLRMLACHSEAALQHRGRSHTGEQIDATQKGIPG